MAHDREVAGIRCVQVLARLSAYVDGELPAADVAQIEAHLTGCDWCERFGGEFASMVTSIRAALGVDRPMDAQVVGRLFDRLAQAMAQQEE